MSEFWEGFKDLFSEFVPTSTEGMGRKVGEVLGVLAGGAFWVGVFIVIVLSIIYMLR